MGGLVGCEEKRTYKGQGWFAGIWLEQMTLDKEHVKGEPKNHYILEHAVCKMAVGHWLRLIRERKTEDFVGVVAREGGLFLY